MIFRLVQVVLVLLMFWFKGIDEVR